MRGVTVFHSSFSPTHRSGIRCVIRSGIRCGIRGGLRGGIRREIRCGFFSFWSVLGMTGNVVLLFQRGKRRLADLASSAAVESASTKNVSAMRPHNATVALCCFPYGAKLLSGADAPRICHRAIWVHRT